MHVATPHVTQNVLAANNINTLDRPAKSPDLSPIEHLWDYLGRTVRGRNDVNNVNDLKRALHEEWARVPRQFIQRLINSMRRRLEWLSSKLEEDIQDIERNVKFYFDPLVKSCRGKRVHNQYGLIFFLNVLKIK